MISHWRGVSTVLILVFGLSLCQASTQSKAPAWQPSDHPRLLSSPSEKAAAVAKLTAPGTASAAIWSAFLVNNFSASSRNYGDGAFRYWVTNNATPGQQAIQTAENWMTNVPNGITPSGGSFNESWYQYLDLLVTYDFAYNLLSPQQKTRFIEYIALQGSKCHAAGPGYAPGNINLIWMVCVYGSAMLLEGENVSIQVTDEAVFRGLPNSADLLKYPINLSNFRVSNTAGQSTSDYVENTDFVWQYVQGCGARCIDWAPTGTGIVEPAVGSTYYVSYTFTPDIAVWKSDGRSAFEYHLNYQWRDGYYQGGLNPYGTLASEQLPVMIEMLRRDTGIDYSRNQDVRHIVDNYIYSKLPNSGGLTRRFNTINDTGGWTNFDADAWTYPSPSFSTYHSWLRSFVAWGTTAYTNDPEGYDDRYLWLWASAYRNSNGTIKYTPKPDWREALWINNAAVAPYIGNTSKPPAVWDTTRYFRGAEVIYARTDQWNQPNTQAALMSMIAGNHNYQNEHDQGDAGSFTFFSHDEDWAIDPGYAAGSAGGTLQDHNLVGIDNDGYNATGVYGIPDTTSYYGAYAHFDDVALTAAASTMKANLSRAWTLTSTPFVQRDERFVTMVNGTETSYMIVADDIQKDNSNHSYQWYLHTGLGNTITTSGNKATITGNRVGAKLDVFSLGPTTTSWSQSASSVGNLGAHQVLKNNAPSALDPYFFHLLLPTAPAGSAPAVASLTTTGGSAATITWPSGTQDTILWRTTGPSVAANGITSDARLTVVRKQNGVVTGLIVTSGRAVSDGPTELLDVADGVGPVSVSALGSTVAVYGQDASQIRLQLPNLTSATLEDGPVTIPVEVINGTAYINAGQPFSTLRKNNGVRYASNFDDGSLGDLFRVNLDRSPAEQFAVVNGALELRTTGYDWPSISKRDSTVWRHTGLYPNVIPAVDHAEADYSWRWKYNGAFGNTNGFRIYLRTVDRNAADWLTNQDYVRLDFSTNQGGLPQNTLTVGQRVNGSWVNVGSNDVLTSTLPAVTVLTNTLSWHDTRVRLLGNKITVWVDGQQVLDETLPTPIPTAPANGYIQFRVIGTTPILFDDLVISSIDKSNPVAPTAGTLLVQPNNSGQVTTVFGQGTSSDAAQLILYESPTAIVPTTNPAGLSVIGSSANVTGLSFTGVDRTKYHAVAILDQAGNSSLLTPVVIDATAPSAVTDLQTE